MDELFILIAEDDADDRFLLQTVFEEKNFTERVHFVENGVELIDYLDKIAQTKPYVFPKIILLDLNMPKKDGREALKEIKQHPLYRKIPVIVFTTTKSEHEINRCYELGANTYIVKPVSFDKLIKVMEDLREYWLNTASIP